VFIRICGKQHYLWRAVDQDGNALDILLQSRRSAAAAKRFFRKLLKGLRYVPRAPRQRHHAWNTHKMQAIVGHSLADYPDELIARIAPTMHQHINMRGILTSNLGPHRPRLLRTLPTRTARVRTA
jgi:hypothetical protein